MDAYKSKNEDVISFTLTGYHDDGFYMAEDLLKVIISYHFRKVT